MAKYKVTIAYLSKASTIFETDDKAMATSFLEREIEKANSPHYDVKAIFFNERLKWRKR